MRQQKFIGVMIIKIFVINLPPTANSWLPPEFYNCLHYVYITLGSLPITDCCSIAGKMEGRLLQYEQGLWIQYSSVTSR